MKKSMKRFFAELVADLSGKSEAEVRLEISRTCDVTEWFYLSKEEKKALRSSDDEIRDLVFDILRDRLVAAVIAA